MCTQIRLLENAAGGDRISQRARAMQVMHFERKVVVDPATTWTFPASHRSRIAPFPLLRRNLAAEFIHFAPQGVLKAGA